MPVNTNDINQIRVGVLGVSVDDSETKTVAPAEDGKWTGFGPQTGRNTLNPNIDRVITRALNTLDTQASGTLTAAQGFDARFTHVVGDETGADKAAFDGLGKNLIQTIAAGGGGGGGLGFFEVTEADYFTELQAATLKPGLYQFIVRDILSREVDPQDRNLFSEATSYSTSTLGSIETESVVYIPVYAAGGGIGVFSKDTGMLQQILRLRPYGWPPWQNLIGLGANGVSATYGATDNYLYFTAPHMGTNNATYHVACLHRIHHGTSTTNPVKDTDKDNRPLQLRAGLSGGDREQWEYARYNRPLTPTTGGTWGIPCAGSGGYVSYFENGSMQWVHVITYYNFQALSWVTVGNNLMGFVGSHNNAADASNRRYDDTMMRANKTGTDGHSARIPNGILLGNGYASNSICSVAVGKYVCLISPTSTTPTQQYTYEINYWAFVYDTENNTWKNQVIIPENLESGRVHGISCGHELNGKAYFQVDILGRLTNRNSRIIEIDPERPDGDFVTSHEIPITVAVSEHPVEIPEYFKYYFLKLDSGVFFGTVMHTYNAVSPKPNSRPYLFDPQSGTFQTGTRDYHVRNYGGLFIPYETEDSIFVRNDNAGRPLIEFDKNTLGEKRQIKAGHLPNFNLNDPMRMMLLGKVPVLIQNYRLFTIENDRLASKRFEGLEQVATPQVINDSVLWTGTDEHALVWKDGDATRLRIASGGTEL